MTTASAAADDGEWDGTLVSTFPDEDVTLAGTLVSSLRDLLDAVAAMRLDRDAVAALTETLDGARRALLPLAAPEVDRLYGRIGELPVRGRGALPELRVDHVEAERRAGIVRFGPWFLGAGGAAHGGAVAMMFDDLLGRTAEPLSHPGLTRTAYLHVDYRHLTPVEVDLRAEAWVDRVEGRKIFVRGELRAGRTVCAEAEALMLRLLPGQGSGKRVLP